MASKADTFLYREADLVSKEETTKEEEEVGLVAFQSTEVQL